MNCSHIILQSFSIIDAIRCINEIHNEPLVLFVVDENKRMQLSKPKYYPNLTFYCIEYQ